MENPKKLASLLIRLVVAVGALAWVLLKQDWVELAAAFRGLEPAAFGLGLLVFALAQVVLAIRWWLLLWTQSIHLHLLATVRLHFLGLFFNNLMPSSVGGDFLRAWYVTKHTEKRFEAALSVFVDRAVGLSGILLMALVSYGLLRDGLVVQTAGTLPSEGPPDGAHGIRVVVYVALALFAGLAIALLFRPIRTGLLSFWRAKREGLVSLFAKARRAAVVYWKRPWALLLTIALTLFLQSATIIAFWVVGRSIGIKAHPKYYFVIFPSMWVVAALPVSIAGIGVLEGGITVLFMSLAGASSEQATCLALCQRFIWILTSLPGAAIHLFGGHLPKTFSFDADPEAG